MDLCLNKEKREIEEWNFRSYFCGHSEGMTLLAAKPKPWRNNCGSLIHPWKGVLPDHGMQCQQKLTYWGRSYTLAVTLSWNTSFSMWAFLSMHTFPATPLWGILSLQPDASGTCLLCFHGISLLSGQNLSSSLLEFRILYLCCCD